MLSLGCDIPGQAAEAQVQCFKLSWGRTLVGRSAAVVRPHGSFVVKHACMKYCFLWVPFCLACAGHYYSPRAAGGYVPGRLILHASEAELFVHLLCPCRFLQIQGRQQLQATLQLADSFYSPVRHMRQLSSASMGMVSNAFHTNRCPKTISGHRHPACHPNLALQRSGAAVFCSPPPSQ